MKKLTTLIAILFVNSMICLAQEADSLKSKLHGGVSMQIGAIYTPLLSQNFYGMSFDIKYYPKKRFATGFEMSISEKKISDTFSYSIQKPILDFIEFGWINQYDILQSKHLRLGINLNNGIAISRLGDNTEKETYYTEYGYEEIPKKVASNYFYLLEPGVDFSLRLFSIKNGPDFYLTSKAKYRFVFGKTNYGNEKDFINYYFGIGLTLIGF
jgi:hypothetical protein